MKCRKETDYRTVDPSAVYELKKVALRLRRKGKEVKEICETTGLADKTVRMTFAAYDAGGIDAIKPKKRGRRTGEKRTLSVEQEQEIIAMLVDHDPAQFKLNGCMWTRGSVKELIQQSYGITAKELLKLETVLRELAIALVEKIEIGERNPDTGEQQVRITWKF